MRYVPLLLLATAFLGCAVEEVPAKAGQQSGSRITAANGQPGRVATSHLRNMVRVHAKVYSGGLPEGDDAFAELKSLGIKTVISVDGAQPDVEAARKFGLRYVHLPHGYDGISDARAFDLAKAICVLPGPLYIHCHHGQHRSPAAAAVACVGAGLISSEAGLAVLEVAGTSPHYRGLFQSAARARKVEGTNLDAWRADFPERAALPALAEAMVEIEQAHTRLRQLAANDWRPLESDTDLDAEHEAVLLREHFTELARNIAGDDQPQLFRQLLQASEAAARELESALHHRSTVRDRLASLANANDSLQRVTTNCAACHQQFRDVPLDEKRHCADR